MPARAARPTTPAATLPPLPPSTPPTTAAAGDDSPAPQPAGYRGLKVWQRSMDLAASAYRLSRSCTDAALLDELWRSASAIPTHIAVGNTIYARGDYIERLSAAHGQVARLESLVYLADRIGAIPSADAALLLAGSAEVGRMLRGLARALQQAPARPQPQAAEMVN